MIKVWSLPARLIHWTLVFAFAAAFYTRDSELMRDIHVDAGYVAGIVILMRWIMGFVVRDFSAFRRFPPNPWAGLAYLCDLLKHRARRYIGHNPAGALAVYCLLVLGTLTSLTGYMAFNDIPLSESIDVDAIKTLHDVSATAWLVMICLHVTGVLVGSFMHKENLPMAMITGNKQRRLVPDRTTPKPVQEPLPAYVRHQYIEEAAYYIAESRGFQSGEDWDHWLEAERQVDERLHHAYVPPETKASGPKPAAGTEKS